MKNKAVIAVNTSWADGIALAGQKVVVVIFQVIVAMLLAIGMVWPCYAQPESAKQPGATDQSGATGQPRATGQPVLPGQKLSFPQDHGAHPEQSIEWWYLTANLISDQGKTFGLQWTLFRTLAKDSGLQSAWWDNNIWFSHFALQDDHQHQAFERFARAGQAGVSVTPFSAWLDHWSLSSTSESFLPLQLNAQEQGYQVNLTLDQSPLVLHGEQGYSQKTFEGHASYYYSYPLLQVTGSVVFDGQQYPVTGQAWYDREWSSGLLDDNYSGWEWFSIQKSPPDKGALMVFCLRDRKQAYHYCSGSDISPSGEVERLEHQQIQLESTEVISLDQETYPVAWQLTIQHQATGPDNDSMNQPEASQPETTQLKIESINRDSRNQLSVRYWEGRVRVSGSFSGLGYAELTGY